MSEPAPELEGVAGLRGRRAKAAGRVRRTPPAPLHPRPDAGQAAPERPSEAPEAAAGPLHAAPAAEEEPVTAVDLAAEPEPGGVDPSGAMSRPAAPTEPTSGPAALTELTSRSAGAPPDAVPGHVVATGNTADAFPQVPPAPPVITSPMRPEVRREISRDISREVSHPVARELPDLGVDTTSAMARLPKPTVMTVPASIMARFSRTRRDANSHTDVVLNALQETITRLPMLVAEARPQPRAGELFPLRGSGQRERRDPLRVRPTVAELAVIDRIVEWVGEAIEDRYPGSPRVNRSEVVAAALDAYLPGRRSRTIPEA